MRSTTSREAAALPGLQVAAADGRPRRRRRATAADPATQFVHRLGSDTLASLGFPAGTRMVVDTARPPRRGHILFVRTQGRLRVGVFEVELGRAVLRSDGETFWLDHTTEVWGVAIAADPPLDGLTLDSPARD